MAIPALLIFVAVIAVAFFKKMNVGVLALAVGAIAVRIFGLTDKDLLVGISVSLFATLVGITLLFAIINSTGALELLAKKIISLAKNRVWIIPIAIFAAGLIIAGVGPGAIPALAIVPALACSVALQVGYHPIMLMMIGGCGITAGRVSPLTPEAAIISEAATMSGVDNAIATTFVCMLLVSIVNAIVVFFVFKGHRLKKPLNDLSVVGAEKFNGKQIMALVSILVLMVLLIFVGMDIALASILVAVVLLLCGIDDDSKCIKMIPWSTIIMVLGVGALLLVVDEMGGISLMSDALASVMNKHTAVPLMGVSAGLLSLVSSATGVVYPTMMPMAAEIAGQISGVAATALMAAVGIGGSLAGCSPMSTGGALFLAALGSCKKNFSKEEQSKAFMQLLFCSGISFVCIIIVSGLAFNPIANLIG